MKILVGLLIFSLLINFTVFYLDTLPFLLPKIKRRFKIYNQINYNNLVEIEKIISDAALNMVKSSKVTMIWSDNKSMSERVFIFLRRGSNHQFKTYNYPRAYLYYGLIKYFTVTKNSDLVEQLKISFDKLISEEGRPKFILNKVDQAPFGIVAIELFKIYKNSKYEVFFNELFHFLKVRIGDSGLILYRKGQNNQLNDLIGMILPFLIEYYKITNDAEALRIAKKQLDFYIKYGLDKETFIPSHGIHLKSKIKTGSSNWGRGIGWYLLGLSYYYEVTGEYYNEFIGIKNSLVKLQLDNNLYSQFPGSSNTFDASTSTMFLYSFIHLDDFVLNKEDVLGFFSEYVDKKGRLMQTSGDTYGLNGYSESFGLSELSQGLLLLLLSKAKQ